MLCPVSRAQCTFSHDDLTDDELEIYGKLGTKAAWEQYVKDIQTAQLVFDWIKVTLKGTGPNSCIPKPVEKFVGAPLDVLNPLFWVEVLVAGPCAIQPRAEKLYKRLNNLYKAVKVLGKVPYVGPVFKRVAFLFKKPVDALDKFIEHMKSGCEKVSATRQKVRRIIERMDKVGTLMGKLGSYADSHIIAVCNLANENAKNARVRSLKLPNPLVRGLQANEVDDELINQTKNIRARMEVTTAVYDFFKDFDVRVAPVLNELKADWDRVELELDKLFDSIEDVMEIFAPLQEMIDVLGEFDCSAIPVLSFCKLKFPLLSFNNCPAEFLSNSLFYFSSIPSTVCDSLDFVNGLVETILDALGIGDLLKGIEDEVMKALNLPDLSVENPLQGLIDLDLDTEMVAFDDFLSDLWENFMVDFPNPIDAIHEAVESVVSELNNKQPGTKSRLCLPIQNSPLGNVRARSCQWLRRQLTTDQTVSTNWTGFGESLVMELAILARRITWNPIVD
jgi:hypothetical protein